MAKEDLLLDWFLSCFVCLMTSKMQFILLFWEYLCLLITQILICWCIEIKQHFIFTGLVIKWLRARKELGVFVILDFAFGEICIITADTFVKEKRKRRNSRDKRCFTREKVRYESGKIFFYLCLCYLFWVTMGLVACFLSLIWCKDCIKNSGTFPKSFGTLYLAFLELRTLEIVNS